MKSGNITVTDGRLLNALHKVSTEASKTVKSSSTDEAVNDVQIRTGTVKKFYYNWDRAEIEVNGETLVARLTHPLAMGCSLYFTPFGDLKLDKNRNHTYFNIDVNAKCLVLSIDDSHYLLAYYNESVDTMPAIASGGVVYLESYGEHIKLGGTEEGGISFDASNLILKDWQDKTQRNVVSSTVLTEENLTNSYSKEEVDETVNKLYERIELLEEKLGITFEKTETTLKTSDLTKKYDESGKFEAILTTVEGTPLANTDLTFKINGVTYTKTTDENGVASLNINLNVDEYVITTNYEGDELYASSSVENKVIVTI